MMVVYAAELEMGDAFTWNTAPMLKETYLVLSEPQNWQGLKKTFLVLASDSTMSIQWMTLYHGQDVVRIE